MDKPETRTSVVSSGSPGHITRSSLSHHIFSPGSGAQSQGGSGSSAGQALLSSPGESIAQAPSSAKELRVLLQIPSPVSIPIAPHPSPAVRVMNLSGSLPQRLGVVDHLGVGGLPCEWGSVAQRRAIGNGCRAVPSSANTPHLFSPLFLNTIWREHKNMHLTRLILLSA